MRGINYPVRLLGSGILPFAIPITRRLFVKLYFTNGVPQGSIPKEFTGFAFAWFRSLSLALAVSPQHLWYVASHITGNGRIYV